MRDWDEEFASLQSTEYFPGSSRPRIRHANRPVREETRRIRADVDWDAKPQIFKVSGEEKEFFTVGQLAQALGRQPGTIRLWERQGILPKPMKFPSTDPRGRRRLYTRAQVEGMVRIATEEGLLNNDFRPIKTTNFQDRVLQLFLSLGAQ